MKTLGTFVLGAAVGFVACGALTVRGVLNSERHRKAIAKVVSEKVNDELFGKKFEPKQFNPKKPTNSGRATLDPIDVEFESREEANTAFDNIKQIVADYGYVTVADVCDICEMESYYMDNKYGWTDCSGMSINGFDECELHLPKPIQLAFE